MRKLVHHCSIGISGAMQDVEGIQRVEKYMNMGDACKCVFYRVLKRLIFSS